MKLTHVTITDNRTGIETRMTCFIPESEGELLTLLALDAGARPEALIDADACLDLPYDDADREADRRAAEDAAYERRARQEREDDEDDDRYHTWGGYLIP